jgi:hypothetical protein
LRHHSGSVPLADGIVVFFLEDERNRTHKALAADRGRARLLDDSAC